MTPVCSAKDCTRPAAWTLLWNNPKLHTPDRRKSWLACDEHRDPLADFLRARRFLRDVERFEASTSGVGGATTGAPGTSGTSGTSGTKGDLPA